MPIKKTNITKNVSAQPEKKAKCCSTGCRCYSIIAYVVLVLIVIFSGLKLWMISYQFNKSMDNKTYQVVFLDNGESYFGKLSSIGFKKYKLNDVYYLKQFPKQQETADENATTENAATETDATADVSGDYEVRLIKLGEQEFYKPTDTMIISSEHIIYWENLQPSSEVMDFINK